MAFTNDLVHSIKRFVDKNSTKVSHMSWGTDLWGIFQNDTDRYEWINMGFYLPRDGRINIRPGSLYTWLHQHEPTTWLLFEICWSPFWPLLKSIPAQINQSPEL